MELGLGKPHRFPFFHKLYRKETASCLGGKQSPSPLSSPDIHASYSSSGYFGTDGALSDSSIHCDFEDLYVSIVEHVGSYYVSGPTEVVPSQGDIEVAATGLSVPWPQIQRLLKDPENRHGVLTLCIAWVTLSRCLLLKLGMSNSPGSSFLPPEIVECFQSFAMVGGLKNINPDGHCRCE